MPFCCSWGSCLLHFSCVFTNYQAWHVANEMSLLWFRDGGEQVWRMPPISGPCPPPLAFPSLGAAPGHAGSILPSVRNGTGGERWCGEQVVYLLTVFLISTFPHSLYTGISLLFQQQTCKVGWDESGAGPESPRVLWLRQPRALACVLLHESVVRPHQRPPAPPVSSQSAAPSSNSPAFHPTPLPANQLMATFFLQGAQPRPAARLTDGRLA